MLNGIGILFANKTRERRQRVGEEGFTLVEMLVVISIIGLIMGLVGPRVLNYLSESKVKAARIQLQSFGSALDLFYLDAGRFPSSSEGLAALVQRNARRVGLERPLCEGQYPAERPLEPSLPVSLAGPARSLRNHFLRRGRPGGGKRIGSRYFEREPDKCQK